MGQRTIETRKAFFWFFVSAGLGFGAVPVSTAPNELEEMAIGFVNKGFFYSCRIEGGVNILDPEWVSLEKRDAAGRLGGRYRIPPVFMRVDLGFRWHLGSGCVWAIGQGTTENLDPAVRVPLRTGRLLLKQSPAIGRR